MKNFRSLVLSVLTDIRLYQEFVVNLSLTKRNSHLSEDEIEKLRLRQDEIMSKGQIKRLSEIELALNRGNDMALKFIRSLCDPRISISRLILSQLKSQIFKTEKSGTSNSDQNLIFEIQKFFEEEKERKSKSGQRFKSKRADLRSRTESQQTNRRQSSRYSSKNMKKETPKKTLQNKCFVSPS